MTKHLSKLKKEGKWHPKWTTIFKAKHTEATTDFPSSHHHLRKIWSDFQKKCFGFKSDPYSRWGGKKGKKAARFVVI